MLSSRLFCKYRLGLKRNDFRSALLAVVFLVLTTTVLADSVVVFNEIMYHPPAGAANVEWIELHNQLAIDVDISRWSIKGGVKYKFQEGTFIPAGGYIVVANDPAALATVTGYAGAFGPFEGNLSNSGEELRLINNGGQVMDVVDYKDSGDWPVAPDGSGVSLAKRNPDTSSQLPENWTWSEQVNGTCGTVNFHLFDYISPLTTIFSSGLDSSGDPLAPGQQDPHYTFVASGNPAITMHDKPDLQQVVKAINFGNTTDQVIGGITFLAAPAGTTTDGVTNTAANHVYTGQYGQTSPVIGDTADDNALEEILGTSTYHGAGLTNDITIPIANGVYKLQLLLYDGWTNAGPVADFTVEGVLVADDYDWLAEQGNVYTTGSVFTYTFTVTDGQIDIGIVTVTGNGHVCGLIVSTASSTSAAQTTTLDEVSDLNLHNMMMNSNSQWVGLSDLWTDTQPPGTYQVETTFELAQWQSDTASVTLYLTADDQVNDVLLNGVSTAITCSGLDGWSGPFVIDTGFVTGTNELVFSLVNSGSVASPMGLRVHLSGTAVVVVEDSAETVVFSEMSSASEATFWLELVNPGLINTALTGMVIKCVGATTQEYVFPSQSINSGQYLALDETTLGFEPFDGDRLFLLTADRSKVLDAVIVEDTAQARMQPGLGPWYYPEPLIAGAANQFNINDDIVINEVMYHRGDEALGIITFVPLEATASTQVPTDDSAGVTWTGDNEPFDDSGWTDGVGSTTGIGYERSAGYEDDINTDVETEMYGENETVYIRIPFTISTMPTISTLTLKMKYDDGFVAYLNGVEVARQNAPVTLAYNSGASTFSAEAVSYVDFDVTAFKDELKVGQNILAIHGLNYETNSTDMLILPELTALAESGGLSEWIELYNKGTGTVDLTGWEIDGGIDYDFDPGTTIAPGQYLVIAKDKLSFQSEYPGVTVVGDFGDRLGNDVENIAILDSNKNPVDQVRYYDDKPWPSYADGYGASLELRNPNADNSNAQSWAASNEGSNSSWQLYTYRATAQSNSVQPKGLWQELVLGLLTEGEVLLDDISVVKDPDGSPAELIQNGDFESGTADKWRLAGNHTHSEVMTDPDDGGNKVLRLVATGPTNHMSDHAETTLANGHVITNGIDYEISYRAKWIAGSNQLNTRLFLNRVATTILIDKPLQNGTPGAQNSVFVSNSGPVFENLQHSPAVPNNGESVEVSVNAEDSDGIANVTLWWRVDGQSWNSLPMVLQSGSQYTATIPSQPASTIVQFYVIAEDSLTATSTMPIAGVDSHALYKVNDGLAAENGLHNFRIIMTTQDSDWLHANINLMSSDKIGATVIYNEWEIFYDVGVRLKGSSCFRETDYGVGFNVTFHADKLFHGTHRTVAIDRSAPGLNTQREMLIHQMMNHTGGLLSKYSDLIYVMPPRTVQTSSAELQLSRFGDEYLDNQFKNGSDGNLYEYELIYQACYTDNGSPEGNKMFKCNCVTYTNPIKDYGDDKERYRWHFLKKNNRGEDDFTGLINFAKQFNPSDLNLNDLIDVDQWLWSFAITNVNATRDNYGTYNPGVGGLPHNAQFYIRPDDGRVLFFPHDLDAISTYNSPLVDSADLAAMITVPACERLYYGYVHYMITSTYNQEYMSHWTDQFGQLLPGQAFSSHLSFIDQRNTYLTNQINTYAPPAYPFEITDLNFTVATDYAEIHGRGWIDVKEIKLQGRDIPLDIEWSVEGIGYLRKYIWTATVPLEPGINDLVFEAYDFKGDLITTDSITVISTVTERPVHDHLRVTELMYDPVGGSSYEFIELCNTGPNTLDLTDVTFANGVGFAFALGSVTSLAPGEYVVIVEDTVDFESRYGSSVNVAGQYSGKLDNGGEKIEILGKWGAEILSFKYSDSRGWPLAADGSGHSLVPVDSAVNSQDDGSMDYCGNWRTSTYINGSPGAADPVPPVTIVLNEVMAHTDLDDPAYPDHDSNDWIELYNPTDSAVVIGADQWFFSDDKDVLNKWAIPAMTIPAKSWVSFDETTGFHQNPLSLQGFGLNKAGERVLLSYLPGAGQQRVTDSVRFKGQPNGYSLSRCPDGGQWWYQTEMTRDLPNGEPDPVCAISEIMYNPAAGNKEFIEFKNLTSEPLSLWDTTLSRGWRIDGGISFEFDPSVIIPTDGFLLVVGFDPNAENLAAFNNQYGTSLTAGQVVGPYSGDISNNTERIAIERPQASDDPLLPNDLSWIIVDETIYFDQAPWPDQADGDGLSLQRSRLEVSGNTPDNWKAETPSLGFKWSLADFNRDGTVDLQDFRILALAWLSERSDNNWCDDCNLSAPPDDRIDFLDLAVFARQWQ